MRVSNLELFPDFRTRISISLLRCLTEVSDSTHPTQASHAAHKPASPSIFLISVNGGITLPLLRLETLMLSLRPPFSSRSGGLHSQYIQSSTTHYPQTAASSSHLQPPGLLLQRLCGVNLTHAFFWLSYVFMFSNLCFLTYFMTFESFFELFWE